MSPIVAHIQDIRPGLKIVAIIFFFSTVIILGLVGGGLFVFSSADETDDTGSETGTETMSDTGDPCQEFEGQPPAEGDDITPYEECLRTSE